MIGRVFGHIREQLENALPGASRQDSVDPPGDLISLLYRRAQHSNSPQILQPTQQAKLVKQGSGVGTATPLAMGSFDEVAVSVCGIQGFNASKLASCRGDAMVA